MSNLRPFYNGVGMILKDERRHLATAYESEIPIAVILVEEIYDLSSTHPRQAGQFSF